MKILYVTTVSVTMGFFPAHIQMLRDEGHTVELACNLDDPLPEKVAELGCTTHHIPFSRSPLSGENVKAYRKLKKLLSEQHYDIVHTHTPNASAIVRLACRPLRKQGIKVFYTAHGFHFYDGAPLKNWLMFYPVEKFLSRWTDVLITINREDYQRAKEKFHAEKTVYIPGVGLDTERFGTYNMREEKRLELGIPSDAKVLLTVGELNANKNQSVVIRAMAKLDDESLHYVLCGQGENERVLRLLAEELGVAERVHFLGFRKDVPEIDTAADIYLCPSFREGLNVSIMEAMASGLPVICSDIRGNRDLIEQEKGGLRCRPDDVDGFAQAIEALIESPEQRDDLGHYNRGAIVAFSIERVLSALEVVYDPISDME